MLHGHMMDLIIVQDVRVAKPMRDREMNTLLIMRLNVLQPFNLCARSAAVSQWITRQNDVRKCDLLIIFKNSMNVIRNILFPGVSAPNPAFAFALHSICLGDKKYCKHKYFSKHPQSQHPEARSGTLNHHHHMRACHE